MIELEGVTFGYDDGETHRSVLRSADLLVPRGETLAIVGPSGSGKSTLLNLLAGLDVPEAGRIVVAGCRLDTASERERTLFRRRRIGFVFQFFNLIPTLTVAENVGLSLDLLARPRQAARRRVMDLLDRVGLVDRADGWPDRLSGGEQQRVALIAALAHEPEVLLADEPTGSLDESNALLVMRWLTELVESEGRTLVLVTHSPQIAGAADRALAIQDGRLRDTRSEGASV